MGFARSGQSYATSAALYFTIQKYLNEPAMFPIRPEHGDNSCYWKRQDVSSASNIAQFTTYMSLHSEAGNEDYNVVDNDPSAPTFKDLWEFFGEYFGVRVTTKVGYDVGEDIDGKLRRGVWGEIVEKYGGDKDACETYMTSYFFHWCMCLGDWGCWASMEKAKREIGWDVRADSREEFRKIFDGMRDKGVIPKF